MHPGFHAQITSLCTEWSRSTFKRCRRCFHLERWCSKQYKGFVYRAGTLLLPSSKDCSPGSLYPLPLTVPAAFPCVHIHLKWATLPSISCLPVPPALAVLPAGHQDPQGGHLQACIFPSIFAGHKNSHNPQKRVRIMAVIFLQIYTCSLMCKHTNSPMQFLPALQLVHLTRIHTQSDRLTLSPSWLPPYAQTPDTGIHVAWNC